LSVYNEVNELVDKKIPNQPNVIYILADELGYGDVSCLNKQSKVQTAILVCMAKEGLYHTVAHVSSVVCTYARYSILTGRYNVRSTLKQGVLGGYTKPLIEAGRMAVPSMLQNKGYHTACIGKKHLGLDWKTNSDHLTDVDSSQLSSDGP